MTLYRIAPSGVDGWKVQDKWLGLVWRNIYKLIGYDCYQLIEFDTEAEAEKYIWDCLASDAKTIADRQSVQMRRDQIRPRAFP
jgi:hypothetical protein